MVLITFLNPNDFFKVLVPSNWFRLIFLEVVWVVVEGWGVLEVDWVMIEVF